ncbi:NERD domain-containing protein [Deinococcus sp. KSM4-11]|uniref:nuclease-related domain-containing protein n=1 Tax=Deinococcus sp. KSM4-11 TaxID=2568654 RepID=UPI0010A375C0|nr:nuclease-related domain-containing protein [Deinococcus sp. KSM4-11]THF87846.1 NERD domain-containing protein [Deinococcus sp. KSM4-11]
MILKESTPAPTTDRFQRAGDEAEKQMAHYLRRAFGADPAIHVFNDLRLEHGGEAAQIDHLVLHKAGFIIIESKSVTSSVSINDREEWAREWKGQKRGMPSPVLQARRQGDLLRALLQAHREELRNKILFGMKQGGFQGFLIDVVVAISDSGVVQTHQALPEVKKADQVPDRVKELMAEHSALAHPFSRDKRSEQWGFNLTPEEFTKVSAFLRARHTERHAAPAPLGTEPPATAPAAVGRHAPERPTSVPAPSVGTPRLAPAPSISSPTRADPVAAFQCGKCGGGDLEIKFGRSYYFHCRACDGNTAIRLTCPACGAAARTRKVGPQFYRDCPACTRSELYFTNP